MSPNDAKLLFPAFLVAATPPGVAAQATVVDSASHSLRAGDSLEWSEAAAHPHLPALEVSFRSEETSQAEHTLALRQSGVKRTWTVTLNGLEVGQLYPDENPHVIHLALPAGSVRAGENRLRIAPAAILPRAARMKRSRPAGVRSART